MAINNESLFSNKEVPQSTRTELEGRTRPYYQYGMSGRKTWAHVISMCEGNPYEIKLQPGASYSSVYEDSRPKVLLQNISVKAQGEYGSLRRATVELIVFSDAELSKIASAYFIPDMSVRLQWGWSVDCFGQPGPEPITEMGLTDAAAMQQIINRTGALACMDGFQGRVRGWDFTLNKEGAWDVKLDLIAASAAVVDVKVSDKDESCKCEQQSTATNAEGEEVDETKTEVVGRLEAALIDLIDNENFISTIASQFGGGGKYAAYKLNYPGYSRDETGKEDSGTYMFIEADLDAQETYITWSTVESLLTHGVAQMNCGGSPCIYKIDSGDMTIKVPKQGRSNGGRWFSADPRVCFLPGGGMDFAEPVEGTDVLAATALGIVTLGIGAAIYADAATGDFKRPTTNCFVDDETIKLGDILVSSIHFLKRVREISKGDGGTVLKTLNALLADINQACGNVWEFEIHETTIESGETKVPVVLSVADVNSIANTKQPYVLQATTNASMVREVKMDLKLTDAMMTQATYGGKDAKTVPSDNTPCSNRFLQYARDSKNTAKPDGAQEKGQSTCNDSGKCGESKSPDDPFEMLRKKVTTETVNGGITFLQSQKAEYLKSPQDYCKNSMVPFAFSATLTGVGGFRFGQVLTCDRMPTEIKDKFQYQITTVEHNVTPEDWTTVVNTIAKNK